MGTLNYEYKQSLAMSMIQSVNLEQMMKDEIYFMLGVLPRGTKHVSITQHPVAGICSPFTIVFEHPLFEDGSSVKANFYRDCYVKDEKIEQLVVFTGLEFFKPDGTPRYK